MEMMEMVKMKMSSAKSYRVIKVREVRIVKGVMTCHVSPVAMFLHWANVLIEMDV